MNETELSLRERKAELNFNNNFEGLQKSTLHFGQNRKILAFENTLMYRTKKLWFSTVSG